MAETGTEPKVSTSAPPLAFVVIVEVVAAAAALGVVRPETTHTIPEAVESKARADAKTISKLGVVYDGVIVPEMVLGEVPPLVHVAVGVPVKEAKSVTTIFATSVADPPVNPTVTVEAVAMTLDEKTMEAADIAPRACWQSKSAVRQKIRDFIGIQVTRISPSLCSSAILKWSQLHIASYSAVHDVALQLPSVCMSSVEHPILSCFKKNYDTNRFAQISTPYAPGYRAYQHSHAGMTQFSNPLLTQSQTPPAVLKA
jgi:hypothetical protein